MLIFNRTTGTTLELKEVQANDPDWGSSCATERTGKLFVTEMPGSINGSIFGYWIGSQTVDWTEVTAAIEAHVADHDVIGVRYIRAYPQNVHPSLSDKLSLEHPAYVAKMKSQWRCLPASMAVIEYFGTGDQFFGGSADDRPLGVDGSILPRGSHLPSAEFATIELAHAAASSIPNRRPNSIVGVAPRWR